MQSKSLLPETEFSAPCLSCLFNTLPHSLTNQSTADIPGAPHSCVQTGANTGSSPVLQSSNSPCQVRSNTEVSAELRTTSFQGTMYYCLWNRTISPITPKQWVAPLVIPSENLWETAVHHKYTPSGHLYVCAGGTSSKWDGVVAGVCKLGASVLFLSYSSGSVALFKLFSFCISVFSSGKAHPPLGRCCPRLPNTAKQRCSRRVREHFPTGCLRYDQYKEKPWPLYGIFLSLSLVSSPEGHHHISARALHAIGSCNGSGCTTGWFLQCHDYLTNWNHSQLCMYVCMYVYVTRWTQVPEMEERRTPLST